MNNPKGKLNEYCLKKHKTPPTYVTVRNFEHPGPDHTPHFSCEVTLPDDRKWSMSRIGCSKSDLEFNVALLAMTDILAEEEAERKVNNLAEHIKARRGYNRSITAVVTRLTQSGFKAKIVGGGGVVTVSGTAASGISVGSVVDVNVKLAGK